MKRYSILMYNFNGYELFREPHEIDNDCEYVYVTDSDIDSSHWKIVNDHELNGLSVFDKCYAVRFNLFKYITTDVCIYIDASMQLNTSLRPIYDQFTYQNADLGLIIHDKNNVYDEYQIWLRERNYSYSQYLKCMAMFQAANYDPKYKGLYAGGFRIIRKSLQTIALDQMVLNILKQLGNNNVIERLDQTIYSFVLNKWFSHKFNILPIHTNIYKSKYLTWMCHGSSRPHPCNLNIKYDGFLFNELTNLVQF